MHLLFTHANKSKWKFSQKANIIHFTENSNQLSSFIFWCPNAFHVKWYQNCEADTASTFYTRCVDSWMRNRIEWKNRQLKHSQYKNEEKKKKQDECDDVSLKFNRDNDVNDRERERKPRWKRNSFAFFLILPFIIYKNFTPKSFSPKYWSRIYLSTLFPIFLSHLYFQFLSRSRWSTKSKHVFRIRKKKMEKSEPGSIWMLFIDNNLS